MAAGTKRRNSEKRKEKSRDAARCRRGKESEIFTDLANQLPMSMKTIAQLDKASVMRILLSTLKVYCIREKKIPKDLHVPLEGSAEQALDKLYPKVLEGFLIILSKDGDFIYVSDKVSSCLGLQQIDLLGASIFEFTHPCDHDDIEDMLSPQTDEQEFQRTFLFRIKCTLTTKGKNVNLKSASYKVIKCTGNFIRDGMNEKFEDDDDITMEPLDGDEQRKPCMPHFIAVAEPIQHPSNIDIPLDQRTYASRHSMNMKFTDVDDRVKVLVGFSHEDLIGESFYTYCHAQDTKIIEKAFKDLFSKGQTYTGQYRFLAKNGGYVWAVSEATMIYNSRTQKPQCVVCVHYVLSHVEQHGRILGNVQMPVKRDLADKLISKIGLSLPLKPARPPLAHHNQEPLHIPTFSTEDVFVAKTSADREDFYFPEGMKKRFDEENRVDLSHLAPSEGELFIPLVPPSSKIPGKAHAVESFGTDLNLYDDFARLENSGGKAVRSPMSVSGRRREVTKAYSSTSSRCSSPDHSDMSAAASPSKFHFKTIDPNDMSAMDSIFTSIQSSQADEEEIDFSVRAPFIPMNIEEDSVLLPQSTEVMLNAGTDFNPGIFGSTESVFNLKDQLYEGPVRSRHPLRVQQMLEGSTVKAKLEQPQDTHYLQKKRPLDRSCLEKGPPAKKMIRLPVVSDRSASGMIGRSVLMNLLLRGEDKDHGYSVQKHDISENILRKKEGLLRSLLTEVSRRDCEVNAPVPTDFLLHGKALVEALNLGTPRTAYK